VPEENVDQEALASPADGREGGKDFRRRKEPICRKEGGAVGMWRIDANREPQYLSQREIAAITGMMEKRRRSSLDLSTFWGAKRGKVPVCLVWRRRVCAISIRESGKINQLRVISPSAIYWKREARKKRRKEKGEAI